MAYIVFRSYYLLERPDARHAEIASQYDAAIRGWWEEANEVTCRIFRHF